VLETLEAGHHRRISCIDQRNHDGWREVGRQLLLFREEAQMPEPNLRDRYCQYFNRRRARRVDN